MKGLILKDLYQTARYCRTMLLILAVFLGVSLVNPDNIFFTFYPCLLCSMIPVSLLSYDERSHWDKFSLALPYTRSQLVASKYIIGLILNAAALAVSLIAYAVRGAIAGQSVTAGELLSVGEFMAAVSMAAPALCLPWIFKLGTEKGRIVFYAAIVLFFGLAGVLTRGGASMDPGAFPAGVHLLPVLMAALYAGSCALSIVFVKNKEY